MNFTILYYIHGLVFWIYPSNERPVYDIIILSVFMIRHATSPYSNNIMFYKQVDYPTNFTELATNVLSIIYYAHYSI